MPQAFYKCEKCGHAFDSYEKALACENGHLVPAEVRVIEYSSVRAFPYSVEVTFSNGDKRIYNAQDLGG